ncbi:Transcriptional regulatory protein RcsB [Emticicia aquatica]|jgi:DNA-binding NarL/FixJ family response regulator|uniref:Transcriptional regulatory protein RcsB n=1 Tax=Emticicia aquatica TaxID=1681835 RepID=A0ABN8F2L0_9BACT|nr:DNA-binding response regulator [Emticicia aquatica]CAH0997682.1 Transcriptional regulatory protein RcsB [Emticicia aquatica]
MKKFFQLAVVDDSDFVRQRFKEHFHIEKELVCVKTFIKTEPLIANLESGLLLDLLVLDVNLFGVSSLNSISKIRELSPNTKIVIYTSYEDADILLKALRLGACGYLLKSSSVQDIEKELMDFINGSIKISNRMAHKLSQYFRSESVVIDEGIESLTPRELEVLKLLADGYEYDEIGEKLGIATNSVRTHIKSIYRKMQVKNSVQAAKRYFDTRDLVIENEKDRLKILK